MITMRKASPHGVAAAIRKERRALDKERGGSIDEKPLCALHWMWEIWESIGCAGDVVQDANDLEVPNEVLAALLRAVALGCACLEQHGLPKERNDV